MIEEVRALVEEAQKAIQSADRLEDLEDLRVKVLGKKGSLTEVLKGIKDLKGEEKKALGKEANLSKQALYHAIEERKT